MILRNNPSEIAKMMMRMSMSSSMVLKMNGLRILRQR